MQFLTLVLALTPTSKQVAPLCPSLQEQMPTNCVLLSRAPQNLHPEVLLEWPVRIPPDQRDRGKQGPALEAGERPPRPMVGRGWDTPHPVSGSRQGWFIFNTGLAWIPS